MIEMTKRVLASVVATALLGGSALGCSVDGESDGDKAGGSDAPEVLRLAAGGRRRTARRAVCALLRRPCLTALGGSLRVRVAWDAAGQDSPGYERGIARLVRDGDYELGWMGARAWDRMGISASRRSKPRSS